MSISGPLDATSATIENGSSASPSEVPAKAPTILISGAPLSGGGVLTRMLSLLGCAAPATREPAKAEEGAEPWESQPLGDINAQLLAAAKVEWTDWRGVDLSLVPPADLAGIQAAAREALKTEFPDDKPRIFKDPRNSLLQPFWTDLLGEPSAQLAVVMVRNPIEVSASLSRHSGIDAFPSTFLWLRYMLDAEHGSRSLRRAFVSYDELLQSPRAQIEQLETGLQLTLPDSTERAFVEVANYLSGSLRNHRDTNDIFRPLSHAAEWVADVYRIMRSWALHGENPADQAILDQIRADVNRAATIFAPIVRDHGLLARKLSSTRGKLAKEEAGRASERQKLDQTIADLQEKLAGKGGAGEAALADKLLGERNQTIKALQDTASRNDEHVAELMATLEERQNKISSFRRELQKREAALADADAARDELQARAAQYNAEIGALRAAADLHERTLAERDTLLKGAMDARDAADGRLSQLTDKFTEQLSAYQTLMLEKSAVEVELIRSAAALDKAGHDLAWVEGEKQGLRRDIADRDVQLGRLHADLEAAKNAEEARQRAFDEQAAALGTQIADMQAERDALAQERDVDAEERKNVEEALAQAREGAAEQAKRIAALERDGENKSEQLSLQSAQLTASRAKQATLQQERLAIEDQLKQAFEELEQVRSDLVNRETETESLNEYLEAAREQAVKDQDALKKVRSDVQGLGQHLQNARAEAQALKDAKGEIEQVAKLRLEEIEARDKVLEERGVQLSDLESRLAQTHSALLQRQLETEEAAEELRFLRSQLKDEQEERTAREEQQRLTDEKLEKTQAELLAEKDHLARAELDHEKTMQARYQEIALLMSALKDAQEKETDLAHLRVVRHELSRRTDSLYLLFVRVMDAFIAQIASPLLPRKVNLRRQQAVLEKYGLFDAGWYLENNPDVRDAGMDAAAHFVAFGLQEGRTPTRAVDELRRSAAAMADGKNR